MVAPHKATRDLSLAGCSASPAGSAL